MPAGSGYGQRKALIAIMDIGTNTELILGRQDKIFAASCPAGPAFRRWKNLVRDAGIAGAIENVSLGAAGSVSLRVIGGGPPEGICGSGLVDLSSELLKQNRMNALGRFQDGEERIVLDAEREIYFAEGDVYELAQAKGANVAGLQILFDDYGVGFDDVDVFYLAGGLAGIWGWNPPNGSA